jgi:hypothetical protein
MARNHLSSRINAQADGCLRANLAASVLWRVGAWLKGEGRRRRRPCGPRSNTMERHQVSRGNTVKELRVEE